LRSQLGTPVFTFNQAVLAPYVFVDLGHGSGSGVNNTRVTVASVGAGVSAQISSYASVSLDYAHALKSSPTTLAHDNQAMLRLSVGF
ncbi:MAG: hypothetical protein LBQ32_08690, partial [Burkholderiaceae bacterium]|nr:hypothetical protein [Burkholderiaceae bacterium]